MNTADIVMQRLTDALDHEREDKRRMEDQLSQALRDIQDLRREVIDLRSALSQERIDCDRKLAAMQRTIESLHPGQAPEQKEDQ